jgi:hypothetical protein
LEGGLEGAYLVSVETKETAAGTMRSMRLDRICCRTQGGLVVHGKRMGRGVIMGDKSDFWLISAENDWEVAGHLYEKGDYSYALFFGI